METDRLYAQLKQRFASEVLWHFTGADKLEEEAYQVLISILQTGVLRVGKEKEEFIYVDWNTKKPITLYGFPVSCLADIPFKDLQIHAERYGQFAIGFHKESVINNHFNPVLYINQHSYYFAKYIEMKNEIEEKLATLDKGLSEKFNEFLFYLGSVVKSGDLKANPIVDINWDKLQINNFYYEREWRGIQNWNFKEEDIATILVHDKFLTRFLHDKKNSNFKISDSTPVLPISMVHRL